MDRFFVEPEHLNLDGKTLYIDGEDVKHISKVLRYGQGDEIEVCDSNGHEYICRIESIDKTRIDLSIVDEVDINRESRIRVSLYQGVPKSTKMDIILQKLTEAGVDEIVLVNTKRSVVNIKGDKADKKFDRWERIIYEAAKQCKRGLIPKLRGILTFKEALEDMGKNDINICPYEVEKSLGIKEALQTGQVKKILENKDEVRVGIFIGPEGGFAEEENEMVKAAGIASVTMGPRIFRTETASIVATAITLYELGDIGGI
ncbi:MAG: 16S rRNA (uracil(1498)-N(3))-methyltransferase [Peptostreptococcus sp.]|jgi:RNA methyltransferase, rsmE family|uniref:16S rRNA (uracil(1498)-N(3))-methyltransferase n=1 Tax=Peptostreptococcus sp. TaxID=1262 RepID=UPI001CB563DE|nr:16S rRNA (uracil(1498)-N(3))-methyltransferase [Peptostreptococcus sp.]MBF1044784.1 16S rRNA (uracil(1498)-N(3))-methyltransferase [Peptostreptococcus sp.]